MFVTVAVATAPDSGSTFLLLLGLAILFSWLASLRLHPFTACIACKGSPRKFGMVATRSWRMCSFCRGSGRRLRAGARLWARNRD